MKKRIIVFVIVSKKPWVVFICSDVKLDRVGRSNMVWWLINGNYSRKRYTTQEIYWFSLEKSREQLKHGCFERNNFWLRQLLIRLWFIRLKDFKEIKWIGKSSVITVFKNNVWKVSSSDGDRFAAFLIRSEYYDFLGTFLISLCVILLFHIT